MAARTTLQLAAVLTASSAMPCTPSKLSPKDAAQLLRRTPQLEAARKVGGKPHVMSYVPTNRNDDFFYFVVYGSGPQARASADGGLIGYFAVQKDTARVFDDVLSEEVTGEEIEVAQHAIRAKLCITSDVLESRRDERP
jgi:hypothetical protein